MKPTSPPLLAVDSFVFLYVECHPGLGKNNSRYADRGSKRLSDSYKTYRDFVWLAWCKAAQPRFVEGPVGVEIVGYWDRIRQLDYETPYADVDAIDKGTLDALHMSKTCSCDCLDTDARVEPLILRKKVDKENPHVEILIWRAGDQR